jgi:hypothetical protein
MITITIPRLPGMRYAIELRVTYRGWGKVLRDAFLPWR